MRRLFPRRLPSVTRRFLLEELEERIVFDAAATFPVDIPSDDAAACSGPVADQPDAQGGGPTDAASPSGSPSDGVSESAGRAPLNVILVASSVVDAKALAEEAGDSVTVIGYDSNAETVESLVQKLMDTVADEGRTIDTLAVLDHGAPGLMKLGSEWLSEDSLTKLSTTLTLLASVISENGQIQLYGCDTASGDEGARFVDSLAVELGRTVLASVDDTGGATGDWDLEYSSDPGMVPQWHFPEAAAAAIPFALDGLGSSDAPIKIVIPGDPTDHWFWITDLPENGDLYETESDALNKIKPIVLGADGRFKLADPEIWFMSDVQATYDTSFDYDSVKVLLDDDFSAANLADLGLGYTGQNYNHYHPAWGTPQAANVAWWMDVDGLPGDDHTGLLGSSVTGGVYTTNHYYFNAMAVDNNYDVHVETLMDSGGSFGLYYYADPATTAGRTDLGYSIVVHPIEGFLFSVVPANSSLFTGADTYKNNYVSFSVIDFSGGQYGERYVLKSILDYPELTWPQTIAPGQNVGGGEGAFDTWHDITVSVRDSSITSGFIHHSIQVDGVSIFELETPAKFTEGKVAVNNWTWDGTKPYWGWIGSPPKNWTPGYTYYDDILVTKPAGSGPIDIHVDGPTPPDPPDPAEPSGPADSPNPTDSPDPPDPAEVVDETVGNPLRPERPGSFAGYGGLSFTTWDVRIPSGEAAGAYVTPSEPAPQWPTLPGGGEGEDASPRPEELGPGYPYVAKAPTAPITGLPDHADKTAQGFALVFNFDEHVFMDLCTDQIVFADGYEESVTGLYGWPDQVKAGKVIVFNMSEINAMDLLTMPLPL